MNIILDLTTNYHVNVVLTGVAVLVSISIIGALVSIVNRKEAI
jgi:hypothetical protein